MARRHAAILFSLVLLANALPSVCRGSVDEEFKIAVNNFEYQDYEKAVELFRALLYPENRIADPAQVLKARERLGAAYWFLDRTKEAEEEFTGLLAKAPTHELDPFFYPPELIQFFNGILARLQRLGIIDPPRDPADPTTSVKTRQLEREIIEHNPLVLAFVPFGVGQFSNGNDVTGTFFLTTETLALGSAITSYYLLIETARADPIAGANYHTAFWISQGLFVGLVLTGVLEAALNHVPRTVRRETLEVPIEEGTEGGSAKWEGWTPTLGLISDDGVMIGLEGRFGAR